jgi:hypothetical protein
MKNAIAGLEMSIARARGGVRAPAVTGVVALLAFALSTATPSLCQAQVTGLGSAANYGLLEDGGNVSVNGFLNFSGVGGNVGLQSSAVTVGIFDSFTVNGTAYEGSGVTIGGLGSFSATSIVTGQQSALTSAFAAAGSASSSDGALASTTSISSNTITGTQAVNVVNVSSITHDLTISGNANQVFVINVTGNSGNVINLSNITLTGGVTANHVLFNVTGSGNINLGNGVVNGTFLDTGSGSVTLNGTAVTGGIIAGSGGMTVANSATITADSFAVVNAPELPSITMAGVACLLVLGRAGIARIKRARAA